MSEGRWFLDPLADSPSKLIWTLYGWLVFNDKPELYADELAELRDLLDWMFKNRIDEALEAAREVVKSAAEE